MYEHCLTPIIEFTQLTKFEIFAFIVTVEI